MTIQRYVRSPILLESSVSSCVRSVCRTEAYVMIRVVCRNTAQNWTRVQIICGNKMPTRCNRGFYCRYYCLLNMFRAPLCPSSGAQEYYTVVAACGISCCGFQVAGLVWSWGLCVRLAGLPASRQSDTRPATWKPHHEIPQAATTV